MVVNFMVVIIERAKYLRTILKNDGLFACMKQATNPDEIAICEGRKYRFKTRWLDGITEDVVNAKDVSDANDILAKKQDMDLTTLGAITESIHIWNPVKEEWVAHQPWWVEEKEPYEWE